MSKRQFRRHKKNTHHDAHVRLYKARRCRNYVAYEAKHRAEGRTEHFQLYPKTVLKRLGNPKRTTFTIYDDCITVDTPRDLA